MFTLQSLDANLVLFKPNGSKVDFSKFPNGLVINNLSEWKIKGKENISGSFFN